MNFGFAELNHDFKKDAHIKLRNFGNADATFTFGTRRAAGLAAQRSPSPRR